MSDLLEWLRSRKDQAFDGECHLTNEEADSIATALEQLQAEGEEMGKIGERDGYEKAVQDIDLMTGGDGEYRHCTDHDPERHCPDAEAMKAKIVERFEQLQAENERLRGALTQARNAIVKAAQDTLWCDDEGGVETVVDRIDWALQPKEQQEKGR